MGWTNSAKVGLTIVVAVAILAGAYVSLQGTWFLRKTYTLVVQFDNAQGITKGTEARLSGVRIGEVGQVSLAPNKRANVQLIIDQRYPVSAADTISIATGGLLPTPYIEIVPAQKGSHPETGVLAGRSAVTTDQLLVGFNELIPETRGLVRNLTSLSRSLESFIGDPKVAENWRITAANLEVASERGKALTGDLATMSRQGQPRMARALANLEKASAHFERTSALVQNTVGQNRAKIGATLDNLSGAMASLQDVMEEVSGTLGDEAVRRDLRETMTQLRQAVTHMRETSANLSEATGHVRDLTADPQLNSDLRETVALTRGTMEEAQKMFRRLNRVLGSAGEGVAGTRAEARQVELRADLLQRTSPGRTRLDVAATLPRHGGFFRAGIKDFAEGNHLDLQLGQALGGRGALRYGIHASRLGVGLDLGPLRRPWLEADLYSLDEPRLDVRGFQRLTDALDLTLGVEELFGNSAPSVGVRWRF